MLLKASYILLSVTSLGLLTFEAPRGALLTSSPERGKVERDKNEAGSGSGNATIRRPHFIFLGGYHGGK